MSSLRNTKLIFLGAGASRPFGFPLTAGILPWVLRKLSENKLFGNDVAARIQLNELIKGILPGLNEWQSSLPPAESWEEQLPLITDVLSLIDHLALNFNAASKALTPSELARGRGLLERAIFEALAPSYDSDTIDLPAPLEKERRTAQETGVSFDQGKGVPQLLTNLVDWIQKEAQSAKVSIVSTNYDIAVETELFRRLGYQRIWDDVDFGLDVREPVQGRMISRPENARFAVYKLHGSLNWLRCDLCDHIYMNPVGPIAYLAFLPNAGDAGLCHCGYEPLRHVMVAPSIVRDIRDPNILQVWRSSLEAMRLADDWVIIGYSMPPEDIAIRSLFLRAFNARLGRTEPEVTVVQRGKNKKTHAGYKLLFPKCNYRENGIEGFLSGAGNEKS